MSVSTAGEPSGPGTAGERAGPGGANPQRTVLVTGGGSGIGAAVARTLAANRWRVAICGRRAGALRSVAAQTGALDLVCNIADAGQVAELVGTAVGKLGGLDGLVLDAGIIAPGGVAELPAEDFTAMVAINLTGSFLVAKAALPHLLASGRGAIVSVASVAALRAASGMGGYAATKAGLTMLTQSLAVDHAHEGLRANVVCPGWTITEMADAEMAAFGGERGARRRRRVPARHRARAAAQARQRRRGRRRGRLAAVRRGVLCQRRSDPGGRVSGCRRRRDRAVRPAGQHQ
jgi:meso-butanediol dehydrogenase / (S,S)-butanediol dehydrogenase / diacetyl reductase